MIRLDYSGHIGFDGTDCSMFRVVKTRIEKTCMLCNRSIKKGEYVLGAHFWDRCCMNCIPKFIENIKKEIQTQFIDRINGLEKQYNDNKEKWESHNFVRAI